MWTGLIKYFYTEVLHLDSCEVKEQLNTSNRGSKVQPSQNWSILPWAGQSVRLRARKWSLRYHLFDKTSPDLPSSQSPKRKQASSKPRPPCAPQEVLTWKSQQWPWTQLQADSCADCRWPLKILTYVEKYFILCLWWFNFHFPHTQAYTWFKSSGSKNTVVQSLQGEGIKACHLKCVEYYFPKLISHEILSLCSRPRPYLPMSDLLASTLPRTV